MAAGDIYHIVGGLGGRKSVALLGGAVDDGVQIDTFAAGRVAANDTQGTFTAWVNPADNTGNYAFIGCGDANAVEYFYFAVLAGELHIKAAQAGPDVAFDMVTIGANIKAHEWTHIAVTQDAVKPRLYVNGVEFSLTKGTVTETDVTESGQWFDTWSLIDGGHIGCADSIAGGALLTLEFAGAISNVKYWASVLTQTQIDNDIRELIATGVLANWDMNNGYVNAANPGTYDGTAVGDIILDNDYSEFTSRFKHTATPPVVADDVTMAVNSNGNIGHAIIVKAA